MVKKLTALLLAMLLTASMTACGSQDDAQAGGGVAPGTEDTAGGAVQPPAQEPDAPDQGTVNGGTYTNHLAGISCTLDDSWVFYTQEEIDTLSALLSDGADSEALQQRLAEDAVLLGEQPPGHRQRPVEPAGHAQAAVDLRVQPQIAAVPQGAVQQLNARFH